MGIPSLSGLGSARSVPALRLVVNRNVSIPMPLEEAPVGRRERLGCVRGIVIALGLQAAGLILGVAVWKLYFFFR